MEENKFEPGNIVQLKSGSDAMTVVETDGPWCCVVWFPVMDAADTDGDLLYKRSPQCETFKWCCLRLVVVDQVNE